MFVAQEAILTRTPKESSLFGYCRVLVIVTFVVCIPVVAIVWSSLPTGTPQRWYERFEAFRDKTKDTAPSYRALPTEGEKADTDIPRKPASAPLTFASDKGTERGMGTGNQSSPDPDFSRQPQVIASFDANTVHSAHPAYAASNSAFAPGPAESRPGQGGVPHTLSSQIPDRPSPISQASYETATASPAIAAAYRNAAYAAEPLSPEHASRFGMPPETSAQNELARLQEELKGLGATFFRIQTWGTLGESYRATCYVAAPDNVQYQKHFQSIDPDATTALRSMIVEVRQWVAAHGGNRFHDDNRFHYGNR